MSTVYISVDRDELTGGLQISIGDENGGYRIAGPKYCGMSKTLKRHVLRERDVEEIRRYLRRVKKASAELVSQVEIDANVGPNDAINQ